MRHFFHGWAGLGGFTKIFLCIFVVIVGALSNSGAFSGPVLALLDAFKLEKDHAAPVDYGYGLGAGVGAPRPNLRLGQTPIIPKSLLQPPANPVKAGAAVPKAGAAPKAGAVPNAAGAVPTGGGTGGFFGPAFPWPIIPLHVALLPDGRVLNYGTDEQGNQGGQLVYDVWDPSLGNGTNAHTILPNTTSTDIFCSAASLLASGTVLITGGDLTVNGVRNFSNNKVEIFNPSNNTLTASGQMNFARWYDSDITLPTGDRLILGGSVTPNVAEPTPEVYSATNGWRTLPGISISDGGEWFYPRGLVGPDNAVYLPEHNGTIFRLTTDGAGTMQDTGSRLDPGADYYPSLMFNNAQGNPFSVLTVRNGMEVQLVDVSQSPPVVTRVNNLAYDRMWGNATLLADGGIVVSGGSGVANVLTNVAYQVELYNKLTGTWTLGASAAIPRLYHSSTLLLPDGSVLTGGGGAPGPVNELNAEIYYPPYLYLKDGSGNPAPRPTLISAPSTLKMNQNFSLTVGANDKVGAINLIRLGFNTHSFNPEQRLIPLPFSQNGTNITATLNTSPELVPPGYYMLFVLNTSGVPAVAKIVSVPQYLPDVIVTSLSYDTTTGLFTSVVKNQGIAATPAGVVVGVSYSVDGVQQTWGIVNGPLAAGASVTIGTNGGAYAIPSGTHTITAVADDVNRFAESNKTNNTLSQTITVSGAPSLPDLIPTSLSYDSTTRLFASVVTNQGTAATPAGVVVGVSYSVDGVYCTYGYVQEPLAAGASVTIGTSGGPCTIASGTHTITIFADDVNRIAESNKTNNTLSQTITIGGSSLPDVIVTSLSYDTTTGLFTSVVKNQGTAATPAGVPVGVSYSIDGVKQTWGVVNGPLAAGASVTIGTGGGAYTIPSGTHTITVFADDINRFAESIETNNTLSQAITVP
jgi:Domain of unknown function (DUF1929)/CARDB